MVTNLYAPREILNNAEVSRCMERAETVANPLSKETMESRSMSIMDLLGRALEWLEETPNERPPSC